jgi:ferredoxin-NADP reductase
MSFKNGETSGLPIVSPANMMPVQVLHREVTAPDVVTLYLVLPDTEQAPAPYQPGQFVTLALPTFRGTIYRSYSLCGNGRPDQPWEITIKRLHMGTVSSYLYDKVKEGSLLYASMPRGTFTLPKNLQPGTPLVFVAIGSGITPIMGMLSALALLPPDYCPQVQLHYASKSLAEMIYRRELQELDPKEHWLRRWFYLSSDGNRLTPEAVMAKARPVAVQAHWFMCGPESLKRDLQGLLEEWEVPDEQVHAEVFTPITSPAQPVERVGRGSSGALPGTAKLHVEETGAALDVRANETLLAALERHGYRPDFSCRAGACGVCKLRVLSGQVSPVGEALSVAERRAGYALSCIAIPQGDVTIASGGRAPAGAAAAGAVPNMALNTRRTAVMRTRVSALFAVGGLVFGSWMLTNHKPASMLTSSQSGSNNAPAQIVNQGGDTPTAGSSGTTPAPGTTATPRSGTTPKPGTTATPTPKPPPGATATPQPPKPTATPQPPKPTPTPTTQSGTTKP